MSTLPRTPTGSHPIVEHIRKLHMAINERSLIVGPGLRLSRKTSGSVLELDDKIKRGRKTASTDSLPRWL